MEAIVVFVVCVVCVVSYNRGKSNGYDEGYRDGIYADEYISGRKTMKDL